MSGCRWIEGDPRGDWSFCDRPVARTRNDGPSPWCPDHFVRCYHTGNGHRVARPPRYDGKPEAPDPGLQPTDAEPPAIPEPEPVAEQPRKTVKAAKPEPAKKPPRAPSAPPAFGKGQLAAAVDPLVGEGLTNAEIAEKIGCSRDYVRARRQRMKQQGLAPA